MYNSHAACTYIASALLYIVNCKLLIMQKATIAIPVIALELKNQFTGQTVENSRHQYMYDRDPKEPLFQFNNRILACFGVDLEEIGRAHV